MKTSALGRFAMRRSNKDERVLRPAATCRDIGVEVNWNCPATEMPDGAPTPNKECADYAAV